MVYRCPQILLWVDAAATVNSAGLASWNGPDRILLTRSFSEAIDLLNENRIDAMLVVIDADASQGEQFVRWMKRRHERVPILIASRNHSPELEHEARTWPVVAYLPLPIDMNLLRELLDQLRWSTAVRRRMTQPAFAK